MTDWSRKTWFVTGASSGFGLAATRTIAASGGRVVATARDITQLETLSKDYPGNIRPLRVNVTEPDQVSAAVKEAEAWGGVDVLLNNAGYGFLGGVEESLQEEIDAQFAVNLFSVIDLTRKILPGLRERRSGWIINMSSISGVRGFGGAAFYAASKFAVEGFSEALADEIQPFGLGVLIVEPGYFKTDFSTRSIQRTSGGSRHYPHLAARRERLAISAGMEPGSPEKAIKAILAALAAPTPPSRLALGTDAFKVCRTTLDQRSKELETWRELTESTDFADTDLSSFQ